MPLKVNRNQEVAPTWMQQIEQAERGRKGLVEDWWYNMAYLAGHHYVNWSDSQELVELEDDVDEIRPTHNYVLKIKRVEKAKLTRHRPRPSVIPSTTDTADYAVARTLEAYFHHLMHQWRWDRLFARFTDWKVSTGTGIFKWGWDAGEPNPFCEVVSPFDFYPDPYARTPEQMRWAADSCFMSLEQAHAKYGALDGANLDKLDSSPRTRYNDLQLKLLQNYNGTSDANLPGVTVYELYIKPDKRVPDMKNGKHVVFTPTHVIYEGAYPYDHAKLPYTTAYHIDRANSVWGDSILRHIREVNKEINYAEGQITYNRNLANGKYKLTGGAELEEPPNAAPGQILKLTEDSAPNADIQWMHIPALDGAVLNEPARLREVMHDISMLHEVSQGGVPGRVESGQAIQLLQEADDSVMSESIESSNDAIADGFWQIAALYKQFGNESTTVSVFDSLGVVEHKELKKSQLDEIPSVRFYTDSGLPASPAGRRDTIMSFFQYGIIQDPEEARELSGMRPDTETLQMRSEHKRVADNENLLLLDPDDQKFWPVRPSPHDDHDVHIARHKKIIMERDYRDAKDDRKAAVDKHIEEHYQLREDAARTETRLQMIMQGIDPDAPAEGSGPPPPPGGGTPGPPPGEPPPGGVEAPTEPQLPPDAGGLPPMVG